MKIRYILKEIGDSGHVPSGAKFIVSEYKGSVKFNFLGDEYFVEIRLPIKHDTGMVLSIDFFANNDDTAGMTNKGQALKVISFVVGSIEEWIKRYYKKFGPIPIIYLKYNPKAESGEVGDDKSGLNARDKIYRLFVEKFAKKYGSTTTFTNSGGIVAVFKPPIEIK